MSFHRWLQNLRSALTLGRDQRQHRGRGSPGATTHRPSLEVLEDRVTPSFTWSSLPSDQSPPRHDAADTASGRLHRRRHPRPVHHRLERGDRPPRPRRRHVRQPDLQLCLFPSPNSNELGGSRLQRRRSTRSRRWGPVPGPGDGTFYGKEEIGVGTALYFGTWDYNGDGRPDVGSGTTITGPRWGSTTATGAGGRTSSSVTRRSRKATAARPAPPSR